MTFIAKPIVPESSAVDADGHGRMEPAPPAAFRFGEERLAVARVVRSWRSNRSDRGDVYLKKHWFEIELDDGRVAVVYFDRSARRDSPRWWLYTLDEG